MEVLLYERWVGLGSLREIGNSEGLWFHSSVVSTFEFDLRTDQRA